MNQKKSPVLKLLLLLSTKYWICHSLFNFSCCHFLLAETQLQVPFKKCEPQCKWMSGCFHRFLASPNQQQGSMNQQLVFQFPLTMERGAKTAFHFTDAKYRIKTIVATITPKMVRLHSICEFSNDSSACAVAMHQVREHGRIINVTK